MNRTLCVDQRIDRCDFCSLPSHKYECRTLHDALARLIQTLDEICVRLMTKSREQAEGGVTQTSQAAVCTEWMKCSIKRVVGTHHEPRLHGQKPPARFLRTKLLK
jgi:hypothetical protein